jgi:hypothetical protein
LAYQISQNTKAMKSNAYREVSRIMADHTWDIARDRQLAELVVDQLSGKKCDEPVSQYQSDMLFRAFVMRLELLYNEVEFGVGSAEQWEALRGLFRATLEEPTMRSAWEAEKHIWSKGFVDSVDGAAPGHLGLSKLNRS